METLSHNDLLIINRAIGEIYSARDIEAFYASVFSLIRGVVPYEHCTFNDIGLAPTRFLKITSYSQAHKNFTNKHLPALNAYTHQHPLFSQFTSDKVFKTTDFASKNQFMATAIYNEYYRHLDTETQIGFSIPISPKMVSFVALSRNGADFSERDRLVLSLLKPHMVIAMRNITELEHIKLERNLLHKGEEAERRGAILLQSDGIILCISPFARELLVKYFGVKLAEGDTLPEELLQWFSAETKPAAIKRTTARVSGSVERAPFTIAREGHKIKIKLLNDVTTGDYILTIAETNISMVMQSLQGYGLSSRETEVFLWLSQGKTNAEIAVILASSKRTVEKHLERVFAKLGVMTRAGAAAIIRNE